MDGFTYLLSRKITAMVAFTTLCGLAPCLAQPGSLTLPKPRTDAGKPLMRALAERKTTREFSDRTLSPQLLSDLLWAAFGVNRARAERGGSGRTAPSAMNRQEIDLYLALPEGVYVYEAEPHRLQLVAGGDLRARTGPAAAAKAALTILLVSDYAKTAMPGQQGPPGGFTNVNAGFIGQNVYLFAASEGLGACFLGSVPDAESLARSLKLRPEQHILYAQIVGYPLKQ
jgi:SagB-type dehydrogenase family enzyme